MTDPVECANHYVAAVYEGDDPLNFQDEAEAAFSDRRRLLDLVARMRERLDHTDACNGTHNGRCTCGLDALLDETK